MTDSKNDADQRWTRARANPARKPDRDTDSIVITNWLPPTPLQSDLPQPQFPLRDAFPEHLSLAGNFVESVAEAIQLPVDLPSLLLLSVVGASIAKKFEVQVRPGWVEVPALYTLSVLGSGERKSTTFATMTRPILDWERGEAVRLQPEIAQSIEQRKILEARLAEQRKKAAKSGGAADIAISLARELAETPVVHAPVIYTSDSTSEALVGQMYENHERALVASPEADALDVMMGRYSERGAPNMGIWLKGHSGDSERIARRGRATEFLHRPVLNVAMCVQPEGARGMFSSRAARGRGLLARFLVAAPRGMIGRRKTGGDARPLPEPQIAYYDGAITRLLNIAVPSEAMRIGLSDAATDLFVLFEREIEPELARGGGLGDRQEWGGKLCGAVARIALVLHALEVAPTVGGNIACIAGSARLISGATMSAALAWAPYLIDHERSFAAVVGCDAETAIADRILRWLERRRDMTEFSVRDAFDACRCETLPTVEGIDDPINRLEELGYIRLQSNPQPNAPHKRRGRPPSPRYEVNPLWERGEVV